MLAKGLGAAVDPSVGRTKAVVLEVEVLAVAHLDSTRWNGSLFLRCDSFFLWSFHCWQVLGIVFSFIRTCRPVVGCERELDEDIACGVGHLEALVRVGSVIDDSANALLAQECAVIPVLVANICAWES